MLCRVARLTSASPTSTGFSIATGLTTPDLPTCHTTSSNSVITPSFCSLRAKAPRGGELYIPVDKKPDSYLL